MSKTMENECQSLGAFVSVMQKTDFKQLDRVFEFFQQLVAHNLGGGIRCVEVETSSSAEELLPNAAHLVFSSAAGTKTETWQATLAVDGPIVVGIEQERDRATRVYGYRRSTVAEDIKELDDYIAAVVRTAKPIAEMSLPRFFVSK